MSLALFLCLLATCLIRTAAFQGKPIGELVFPAEFETSSSCILCDLDGTLLNSHHEVSEENLSAIKEVISHGFKFIPATGRTRVSMRNAAGDAFVKELFGDLSSTPGVYQQGLLVYGLNGELIYERPLEPSIITQAAQFCTARGISLVAYAADRIFCQTATSHTDKVLNYKDPAPEVFPEGLDKLSSIGVVVHKLIILADPEAIPGIRAELEPFLNGQASFTTAVPDMLEILPLGGCKGDGVRRLLEHLGIAPENAIAFGDGENDIEVSIKHPSV